MVFENLTFPPPAFAPDALDSGLHRVEWAGFSSPVNLSQQPAAVLPCERSRAGLQMIAARGHDSRVLDHAEAFETLCPKHFH